MTARASLASERVASGAGRAISRLRILRSHAPLVLRPTLAKGPEPMIRSGDRVVRVSLAAGAAGPLGGDDLSLQVHVGAGSALVLNEVAAMLLLPGARGGRSQMRITATVEDDATFVWLPEPLIAALGCDHVHDITITLGERARLFLREELLLGRHRERPGSLTQRLCVRRGGRTLFHQRLAVGSSARGWDSPAVLGAHKCIGNVLVVDPEWDERPSGARVFGSSAAVLPLEGPAVLVSALANDTLALRRLLDQGVSLLGDARARPAAATQSADEPPVSTQRGSSQSHEAAPVPCAALHTIRP